jgi:flagellar hook-length control protein FliK
MSFALTLLETIKSKLLIMEFIMADSIQSIGLQSGPKKLQNGNADVESGGLSIMFAPLIEKASQINTQGSGKMNPTSNLPGKDKSGIKNQLEYSGLKGEGTIVDHEKTGFKELTGHNIKVLFRKNHLLGGVISKSQKPEVNTREAESGSLKPGLTLAAIGKDDSFKKNKVTMAKDGKDTSGIKNLLKYSGPKGEGTIVDHEKTEFKELTDHNIKVLSRKNHLLGGVTPKSQKPEINKLEAESGPLKPGLTLAAIGKDDSFKKNKVAMAKAGKDKRGIKNQLKYSGLKGEGTIVDHEKTGFKELTGHNIKVLSREIDLPTRLVDRISSVVEYHQTGFHADQKMVAVNESVNSYSKESRVLINQIAKGVNGPGRVKIALTPPHLGTLDMDVLVRNNKVQIIIQAENNDVRQTLQSNVETLKNALSNQGLIADSINVIIQEKSDSPGHFGFGKDETVFKEDNNQKENQGNPKGRKDSPDRVSSLFDEENPCIRIDGHISLFV